VSQGPDAAFAARLAVIRERLDVPPGVMLGILRLPILDGITRELEALVAAAPDPDHPLDDPELLTEIELTVDLLAGPWIGAAPEAQGRRLRLVELLRRADGGDLPPRAFDPGDPFGAEMRAMLETDGELRATLGDIFPLASRATAVAPPARWLAEARGTFAAGDPRTERAAGAIRRTLSALVRADVVSRPDLLVGGVRLANQRLGRGLLWLATVVIDEPADVLGTVGVRMGTSGRNDAVVRDTALANTCAALLGASGDPAAAAALASMRAQVTNRNVLKQIDRALGAVADGSGLTVDDVVELALPSFGLDENRRLEVSAGDVTAIVELLDTGKVHTRWRSAGVESEGQPPDHFAAAEPAVAAEIQGRVADIEGAVAEERRRMEARMASDRTWPEPAWRARFVNHPVGGLFGRHLVWSVGAAGKPHESVLPTERGWIGLDGRVRKPGTGDSIVRLWHPSEATGTEIGAWRDFLAAAGVEQPIRQVDRELFLPRALDVAVPADRRFSGSIVDHGQLRTLLRRRGWAAPFVGTWDQGDEATAWRAFDDGLRAEVRYQAVMRLPTGERHEQVRIIAVRFVRASGAPSAAAAPDAPTVDPRGVPPRMFSEALRDLSLVVAVGERNAGA
jgi:uncharacterized protein DUF4132